MRRRVAKLGFLVLNVLVGAVPARAAETVRIGSKAVTDSVILGELAAQLARNAGAHVIYKRDLGGTRLVWDALVRGQIDLYPEYTGTLVKEIFSGQAVANDHQLTEALEQRWIRMTRPLGFNNTYALGMREDESDRLHIQTISDLRKHRELRLGFSNEFMDRADGWPWLRGRYSLPQHNVRGMDHDLAYRALADGSIDLTDLYSTDAEIEYYHLRVLKDDLAVFPRYDAVYLYRDDLRTRAPNALAAIESLAGRIGDAQMRRMNASVKLDHTSDARVAADFLARTLGVNTAIASEGAAARILRRTGQHLFLVGISLLAAIIVAVPLGIVAAQHARIGQIILGIVGGIYTIPSLALLVFMIPLLGIGAWPAIVALFLYSLLPIVRNTHAGLTGIPGSLRESAEALGLPPLAALWRVELPLATLTILAGVRTAAVINVGTATLGGFIGAGGYGRPILRGIDKFDVSLMLEGAIPAALLALAIEGLSGLVERAVLRPD